MIGIPTFFADAATNTFLIRTLIGEDTEAPTTPVILNTIPVTPYQIDVTWAPAVDNFSLIGYRVYRDGLVVATTSQTSFSDFGLTPSTTYAYMVDAFDSFYNFSSTSLPVATTTPVVPEVVVPSSTPTSTPSRTQSTLVLPHGATTFVVTPHEQSASFMFEVGIPVRYTVMWGRTTQYEMGSLATNIYKTKHEFVVTGLEPGTTYFYKVVAVDAIGREFLVQENSFVTTIVAVTSLPSNVYGLRGVVNGGDVALTWHNPHDMTLGSVVRVVRSHLFYPESVTDGVVVYEGTGESFFDSRILNVHSPYYYTVFVIAKEGYVSSGATYLARLQPIDVSPKVVTSTASMTPPVVPPEIGDEHILKASDVRIYQGVRVMAFDMDKLLTAGTVTHIIIPKSVLPPHLKSILVTVYDPTNNTLSTAYLLKLSPNGTQYEATFITPDIEGEAPLMLEVFDYNNATVRRMVGRVTYEVSPKQIPSSSRVVYVLLAVAATTGLVYGFWFLIRRREDNAHAK
jgi:chitodextrinase